MFKLVEGLGAELGLINTLFIAGLVCVVLFICIRLGWLKVPGGKNREPKTMIRYNPHPPGSAPECKEHSKAIIKLNTTVDLKFKEMNRRIDNLERKIDNGRRI